MDAVRRWSERGLLTTAGIALATLVMSGCGLADAIESAQEQAKEQREQRDADGPTKRHKVVRVVDGDTVELANGEHVRLIGIDAPEDGVCGAVAATNKLTRLVEGKRVTLVRGATDNRDRYGRLLRYVDRGATDAGLVMIRSGLAIARYDSRDGYGAHPRERTYLKADRKAAEVGCTAKPAPPEPKPPVSPKPKPKPKTFVDAPSGCAPGYSPCVPAYPPDLDCADTGPVTVTGPDPHGLDGDGDGVACGGD